jgi:hypothetical protein
MLDWLLEGSGSQGYFIRGQYYDPSGRPSTYNQYAEPIGPSPMPPRGDIGPPDLESSRTNEGQYVCPLPRSWYPAGSPCSKTDDFVTGPTQEPWFKPPDPLPEGESLESKLRVLFWVGAGLVALWLATRSFEAYARINRAG